MEGERFSSVSEQISETVRYLGTAGGKDAKGRFTQYLSTKLDVRIVLPCYFYSKEMMHLVWLKNPLQIFPVLGRADVQLERKHRLEP